MRCAATLAVLSCPALATAATVQTVDFPGAATTCGTAIAGNGRIAGIASGGTLAAPTPFLFKGRRFTLPAFTLPAGIVEIEGLNRAGSMVGFVIETAVAGAGTFMFAAGKTTLTPQFTTLAALTDQGTILGQTPKQPVQPLVWYDVGVIETASGAMTTLDDGTGHIFPAGMDPRGAHVVGTSFGTAGIEAWRYDHGRFSPMAVPGAVETLPAAVDGAGNVSGTYLAGTQATPVAHGFFRRGGIYTRWDVPGASATHINGVNMSGQMTGCYTDGRGTHGYIASP
jgi:hypothetical protein